MSEKNVCYKCMVCGGIYPLNNLIPMGTIRKSIIEEISIDFPDWSSQTYICQTDLTKYRIKYVHSMLKSEKGEVTDLEYEVIKSLQQHELITKNVETQLDQKWTVGERLADKIASFGGSWSFLIFFCYFFSNLDCYKYYCHDYTSIRSLSLYSIKFNIIMHCSYSGPYYYHEPK